MGSPQVRLKNNNILLLVFPMRWKITLDTRGNVPSSQIAAITTKLEHSLQDKATHSKFAVHIWLLFYF